MTPEDIATQKFDSSFRVVKANAGRIDASQFFVPLENGDVMAVRVRRITAEQQRQYEADFAKANPQG